MKKTTIFLLVFLILSSGAFAQKTADFEVPQCVKAPEVDGKITDGEYLQAVKLTGFTKGKKSILATEQTQAWLCHDRQNLYLAFHLREFALDPASNMGKEFKAEYHGWQKQVWKDDSIEFRLLPPEVKKEKPFYLGINANAATYTLAPQGFDQEWSKKATIRTSRHIGYWEVEVAIPLNVFIKGNSSLSKLFKSSWNFNITRFEKCLSEKSTWPNMNEDNHSSPESFAVMTLGDINTMAFHSPQIQPADKSLKFSIYSKQVAKCNFIEYFSGSKGKAFSKSNVLKLNPGINKFKIPITGEGEITGLRYGVVLGKSEVFLSPQYLLTVKNCGLVFDSPDKVELKLNDKNLLDKRPLLITLRANQPYNTLEIISPKRTVFISMEDAGIENIVLQGNWEYFADGKWLPAKIEIVGNKGLKLSVPEKQAGSSFKFRIHIANNITDLELLEKKAEHYHVTANGTYPILWQALNTKGLKGNTINDAHLHLLLPEGVKILDVTSRSHFPEGFKPFGWTAESNQYRLEKLGKRIINGKTYNHYDIIRISPLCITSMAIANQRDREKCIIALQADERLIGKTEPCYFYMTQNNKSVVEVPHSFPLTVLAPLRGKQPEKLKIFLFGLFRLKELPNDKMNNAFLETIKSAGINELFFENRYARPIKYGISPVTFFSMGYAPFAIGRLDMMEIYKKYPSARQVKYDGKKGNVSITYLNRHPEIYPLLDKSFKKVHSTWPELKTLFFDFEHKPLTGTYSGDYSPYTLKIFAEEYKIKEPVNYKNIKSKYFGQWLDFRGKELGKTAEILQRLAKKNGFEIIYYSAYDSPENIAHYTLNWKYVAPYTARGYMGYGRNLDDIESTLEIFKKTGTQAIFGALSHGRIGVRWKRSRLLRRIIDSRGGLLCWYQAGWGGKQLTEIAEVTRLAATYEDIILKGKVSKKLLNVKGTDADNVTVLKNGKEFLGIIFNDTAKSVKVSVGFSPKITRVKDFYNWDDYKKPKQLNLTVKPYGITAFHGFIK